MQSTRPPAAESKGSGREEGRGSSRLTSELPGSGGILSSRPEDFVVEEVLAYSPSGQGEHVIVDVQKIGIDTLEAT
jgi:tRNA pseudouridine13 synthase